MAGTRIAEAVSSIDTLATSFRRHLRAENKSPRTITGYLEAVNQLAAFLAAHGMPQAVDKIAREHVEAFIVSLLETKAPATANNRYRALQSFFGWLLDEGEIRRSPMDKMKPPSVPVVPPPVIAPDQLRALFATCSSRDFDDVRDNALLSVLVDTGARRAEVSGLRFPEDVDLDREMLFVVGKGSRPRALPIGKSTAKAIDRYLRLRARHPDAELPWLWLSRKGRLTDSGILQLVKRRGRTAGIADLHPHQLRHTFAHDWLLNGGNEGDLMQLTGWRSRTMLSRYGASAAAERAREAHRKLSPRDRI